jgi:hypothetical protein
MIELPPAGSALRCAAWLLATATIAFGAACSVRVPEADFRCGVSADCPPNQRCLEGYCYKRTAPGTVPEGVSGRIEPGGPGDVPGADAGLAPAVIPTGPAADGGDTMTMAPAMGGAGAAPAAAGGANPAAPGSGCRCATQDACCDGCQPRNEAGGCEADAQACTNDVCRRGLCAHELQPDRCSIAGECYSAASLDPSNPCAFCDPELAPTAWSPRGNGSPCDDGKFCTRRDVCRGGRCVGEESPCPDEDACMTCLEAERRCGFVTEGQTWRNPSTNLLWAVHPTEPGSFRSVSDRCANLVLCGIDDWRMATISELRTTLAGCAATEPGGACGVTDSCVGRECQNDACAGCVEEPRRREHFLRAELADPDAWPMSSTRTSDGSIWLTGYTWAAVEAGHLETETTDTIWVGRCVSDSQ